MLGALLWVVQQELFVGEVFLIGSAALYRACDGAVEYPAAVYRYEHFGRSARVGVIETAEIIEIGARVCGAEHTVNVEAVGGIIDLEALGGNYLEDVSRTDILLSLLDVRHVLLLRDVGAYLHFLLRVLAAAAGLWNVAFEYADYLAHLVLTLGVLLVEVVVGGDVQRDYRLVAQMIVGYQLVVVEKLRVGETEIVVRYIREGLFVIPHHVVGEVAHETARELRSAGYLRGAVLFDETVEERHGVCHLGDFPFARKLLDRCNVLVEGYALLRLNAYIRIAPPAVLVVYRLKYEAVDESLMQSVEKMYRCE